VTSRREHTGRRAAARCTDGERGAHETDANGNRLRLPRRYGQNDRPIALGRKNHLFAGSDDGARYWAIHASLIETCKMNDVDPQAWLADLLDKIANRHPMSRIDELLPWAYISDDAGRQAA